MSDEAQSSAAPSKCGNGLEKIYPSTAVRYGRMNYIGEFTHAPKMQFTCGGKVVIATDRGIEIGQQVSLTCTSCEKSVSREQMRAYAKRSGPDSYRLNNGRILREATEADLAELRHIESGCKDKLRMGCDFAAQLDLDMKIVDCEHIFGGERIVYYFMAEERVDFRELVRRLAGEFQTRIEMRQVGARDEARLLADYETCGRECCCKNFLKGLKPINMHMAKMQKATLDPSKVSGRCGRLKCCLRYEHDSYETLARRLPRIGSRVATPDGVGRVIDRQILTQLVKIIGDNGRLFSAAVEDITERDLPDLPQGESPANSQASASSGRGERDRRRPSPPAPGPSRRAEPRTTPDEPVDATPNVRSDDLMDNVPEASGDPQPTPDEKAQPDAGNPARPGQRSRRRRGGRRGRGRPPQGRGPGPAGGGS